METTEKLRYLVQCSGLNHLTKNMTVTANRRWAVEVIASHVKLNLGKLSFSQLRQLMSAKLGVDQYIMFFINPNTDKSFTISLIAIGERERFTIH